MKKNKVIFLSFILCVLCIFTLTGCEEKTTNEDIKSKVVQEIDYLDTKIVSLLNSLNNISLQEYTITSEEVSLENKSDTSNSGGQSNSEKSSLQNEQAGNQQTNSQNQSENENNINITQMKSQNILEIDENNVDWQKVKNEIETINEAWTVIILDLSSLNIYTNSILNFSSILDESILSIKNEDKQTSLQNLARLYSIIPNLEKGVETETAIQNIKQVKSNIINAYAVIEQEEWTEVENNIAKAEENFKNVTNDMKYIQNKEYKVNKTYVLLKELQNSLSYRDKKLFYVKYKNLMESINSL